MTLTRDHTFEIFPYENTSAGAVKFGIGEDVSVNAEGFRPGANEWQVQDQVSPTRGTTLFGRDQLLGPSWAWDGHINRQDIEGALESLAALRTAWIPPEEVIDTPGMMSVVRYRLVDRVRRIYGRPRRFDAPPTNTILNGHIPVTMDFKAVDAFTYDDLESAETLDFVPSSSGGVIFPVTFPFTSLPSGDRAGAIHVNGDRPAHPIIRFNGPITNPSLSAAGWTVSLDMTIADGSYVEIDTRPWKLTVLRNGVYSEAGKLGRRQWLKDIKLPVGNVELQYRGQAAEAAPTCIVKWRSTYSSL
jgi:hypothetical protein